MPCEGRASFFGVKGLGAMIVTMAHDVDLAKPGISELKGWLWVDAESVFTGRALEPWAMQSVDFARALPKKKKT